MRNGVKLSANIWRPKAEGTCNDITGRGLVEICRQQRLRIPEDVAILGADDDELESRLTVPPLSSIAIPARRVGYEVARTLDRMMSGERPEEDLFLPPVRVIVRQSTDTQATDDPMIVLALQYLSQNNRLVDAKACFAPRVWAT